MYTVDCERQEVFGKYCNGAEVSKSYAWTRGLIMYLVGIVICVFFREVTGDPMVLVLFLVTNIVGGVVGALAMDCEKRYIPGMKLMSVANLLNLVYGFCPAGIGYYGTLVDALSGPVVTLAGIVFTLICLYGIYVAFVKIPKREQLAQAGEMAQA